MAKTRIKVSCAGIIDRCTVPMAVVVADIRNGTERARYVLLDEETRGALYRMRDGIPSCQAGIQVSNYDLMTHPNVVVPEMFPRLIRTHAFDSAGLIHEDRPMGTFAGRWHNGETLWVRSDLAATVLRDLDTWREIHHCRAEAIHAPNWLVLTGCQALALAADLPMPQPCGMGLDHPESRPATVDEAAHFRAV